MLGYESSVFLNLFLHNGHNSEMPDAKRRRGNIPKSGYMSVKEIGR